MMEELDSDDKELANDNGDQIVHDAISMNHNDDDHEQASSSSSSSTFLQQLVAQRTAFAQVKQEEEELTDDDLASGHANANGSIRDDHHDPDGHLCVVCMDNERR